MLVSPPRIVALSEGRTKKAFRLLKSKETKVHKSSETMNKKHYSLKKKIGNFKEEKKKYFVGTKVQKIWKLVYTLLRQRVIVVV